MQQLGGQLVPLEILQRLAERLDNACSSTDPATPRGCDDPVRRPAHASAVTRVSRVHFAINCDALLHRPRRPRLAGRSHGPTAGCGGVGAAHRLRPRRRRLRLGLQGSRRAHRRVLFVIIGTSHYSPHRFTLTRKHFRTPLGIVPTDGSFIDRLVEALRRRPVRRRVWPHLPEHSIELEVVLLQYLYEGTAVIRIVPLVVGSSTIASPAARSHAGSQDDIGRMVTALRAAEAETPEPICYLISGDLAHIGPKFGDDEPVAEPFLGAQPGAGQSDLRQAEAADPVSLLPRHRRRRRRPPHLRPAADVHRSGSDPAEGGESAALRTLCSSARIRKRELRERGV